MFFTRTQWDLKSNDTSTECMSLKYADVPVSVIKPIILHLILQVFECISKIQQFTGPDSKAGDVSFPQRETLFRRIHKGN